MAFWFPVTAQYFQVPPQAHFEATSFAAPSQMQPFCFAPPGPVPYQMYTPMPMHYNSMHEMWMPMHSPADLACPRPLTPADRPLDRPTALHQNQDHSLATQRHRQGPYSAAHHPMTQPRGRQPGLSEQHNYTQSSNPKDKEAATASLAGPSTPSDTQRSRKQLDHLARCWSPASAATSSNQSTAASTSSNAFLTAASQHFHIPTSNLEAHPHSGTDTHADCQSATDQLSRMQLTDADASVSARQASRNGTADGAEQLGCETALMERSDASGSAWQGLTEGLLKDIMKLLPPHCNKRCRLVCRRWHDTLDSNLQVPLSFHVTHPLLQS